MAIESIKVYWDAQVPGNASWAYVFYSRTAVLESGGLDADQDIRDAVDEAVLLSGLDLEVEDFNFEPHDGGSAEWSL